MISFVHTADVHLDAPLASLADRYELRQDDFRRTLRRIRDLVRERRADFWLIAGDLLEHHGGTRSTALFLRDLFASVDPVPVCIAPGNHDPWVEDSWYQTLEWPPNVIFFTSEWGALEFPEKSCVVYGWGFPSFHVYESPLAGFPGKLPGYRRHLMVVHGSVEPQAGEHQPYAPLPLTELARLGMDYVALGHIHKPQTFLRPDTQLPFAAYPGSPEGLSVKERDERYALYGEIDDSGRVRLESVSVQSRCIRQLSVEVTGIETVDQLAARVEAAAVGITAEDLLYLTLTGERPAHLMPPVELLETRLAPRFFVRVTDESWPDVDESQLIAENGVLGRWLRKLADMEAAAPDARTREAAALARREALKRIGVNMR